MSGNIHTLVYKNNFNINQIVDHIKNIKKHITRIQYVIDNLEEILELRRDKYEKQDEIINNRLHNLEEHINRKCELHNHLQKFELFSEVNEENTNRNIYKEINNILKVLYKFNMIEIEHNEEHNNE
jgi:hypothetical protein